MDLKAVVEHAWDGQRRQYGRVVTATAALILVTTSIVVGSQLASSGPGQPTFEVVSVRHIPQGERVPPFFVRIRGGRFEARTDLREVIRFAYEQNAETRIVADGGGPKLLDELFEIQAKLSAEPDPPVSEVRAMTRVMLAERFRLRLQLTTERRTVSVLRRLKPDSVGPQLRPFSAPCTPRPTGFSISDPAFLEAAKTSCTLQVYNGRIRGTMESVAELARLLSLQLQAAMFSREEVIIDGTGLVGRYQVEMDFDPATRLAGAQATGPLPTFHDALRRQLGLNIEKEDRQVPMVVVQSAEMPSGN